MTDDLSILRQPVRDRIQAYLSGGGLFNPELANHDAVRDLIIDLRTELLRLASAETELAALRARIADAPTGFWTAAMPGYVCLPSDWIPIVTKWHDLDRVRLLVEE
jgi:hypothetical protein